MIYVLLLILWKGHITKKKNNYIAIRKKLKTTVIEYNK